MMGRTVDEQVTDGKLPVVAGIVSRAPGGGAVRVMTKRIIKGYFAVSEVAADVRESLSDVYAEAKHEYYEAKTVAPDSSGMSVSTEKTTSDSTRGTDRPSKPQATPDSGVQRPKRGTRLIRRLFGRAGFGARSTQQR